MERLTGRYETGIVYVPQGMTPEALARLAAYEDTGLEPEQIIRARDTLECFDNIGIKRGNEIVKAEQEGRLVVLPCKVGDYVYIPSIESQEAIRVRVQGISVSVSGRTILRFGGYPAESAWGDGCGKDWFLTREEAEKALKGGL